MSIFTVRKFHYRRFSHLKGWMDGRIVLLRPFQQYFSHIRMMGGDNERICALEP